MPKNYMLNDIDPLLHREFKAACSHNGVSMKRAFVKYMQSIVDDYWKYKAGLTGNKKTKTEKGE